MKNQLIIFLLLFSQMADAQNVKTFFEIGINYSRANEKYFQVENLPNSFTTGVPFVNVGLKLAIKIDEKFDLLTGVNLNDKAYQNGGRYYSLIENYVDYTVYDVEQHNFYIDFPLMLSYHLTKKISLNAGTGIDIHVTNLCNKVFSPIDIPANLGMTFRYKRTTLNFLYSIGTIPYINMTFYPYLNFGSFDYLPKNSYNSYFNRQLFINLGFCLNEKRNTVWK